LLDLLHGLLRFMTYSAETRLDHLGFDHGTLEPKRSSSGSWSSWILLMSLSVNVAVIAFLAFQMQDGVLWFEVETKAPVVSSLPDTSRSESLKEELLKLIAKSDDEVISALDDETIVANGYRVQELALAILTARGYQVEDPLRPLGAWPQPMSAFALPGLDGKSLQLKLFSNVGVREVQAVKEFVRGTAVPLTAEGIVRKMKEGLDSEVMKAALFRTDEWTTFARIFSSLSEAELLQLARELGGEGFSAIVEWGHAHPDPKEIGPFAISVFSHYPSSFLAELVASNYADNIVLQAQDDTVVLLYSFLLPQSEAGVRLAMRLLHGQRKLPVWQASQAYLARAASMPTLSSMNRDQVLEWFQLMAHPVKSASQSQHSRQPDLSPSKAVEGVSDMKAAASPAESSVSRTQAQRQMAVKPSTPAAAVPQPSKSPEAIADQRPRTPSADAAAQLRPQVQRQVPSKSATPASTVSTRVATRQLQPYRTYVVRKGDTLWSVAKRFNVDVEKLKYLNGLKGTSLIPGKVLRIPH
jgi:LysM repeat protein